MKTICNQSENMNESQNRYTTFCLEGHHSNIESECQHYSRAGESFSRVTTTCNDNNIKLLSCYHCDNIYSCLTGSTRFSTHSAI